MKELRNVLTNGKVSINTVTYYDETNEFDEGETFYIHPLTSSECQTIEQVLIGWSEQNNEEQAEWNNLVESIKNDNELSQKLWNMEVIEY